MKQQIVINSRMRVEEKFLDLQRIVGNDNDFFFYQKIDIMYIVVFNCYLKSKIESKTQILVPTSYMYTIKKCDTWSTGIVLC